MKQKKVKHLEKIHEMLEGTPVCNVIHRLGICGCGSHEEEPRKAEEEMGMFEDYKRGLEDELKVVEKRLSDLRKKKP